jgi:integrase
LHTTTALGLSRYLLPQLGARLLSDIDTEVIMDMKAALQTDAGSKASGKEGSKKPLSPRSVAKILILGGSVWRYGRRIKTVVGNPFADVKKPRAAKRVPYILDPAEIARLRAALDVPFERLLIELTSMTGLRSGEVRGLTWDAIDLDGKRLFIETQANRRGDEAVTKTESSIRPIRETSDSVESEESCVSDCFIGSPGRIVRGGAANRSLRSRPPSRPAPASNFACGKVVEPALLFVGGSN